MLEMVTNGTPRDRNERDGQSITLEETDVTISDLFRIVWAGKFVIAACCIAATVLVSAYMVVAEPKYTAAMVVASPPNMGGERLPSGMSNLTGLASIAGINLGGSPGEATFRDFIELLDSVPLAERLQSKHRVMQVAYEDEWNEQTGEWVPKRGLIASVKRLTNRVFGLPEWQAPSARRFADYLAENLTLTESDDSGEMVRIEFEHSDPIFARNLLEWIRIEADSIVRHESQVRAERQIEYLHDKLRTISSADHRRALTEILTSQERQLMLTQVDVPFAGRPVEPSSVTDLPTSPRPLLYLIAGIAVGAVLGLVAVFWISGARAVAR